MGLPDAKHPAAAGATDAVAVLSFSRIASDSRVLRQCTLLRRLGYDPLVVAYAEEGDQVPFRLASRPAPRPTTAHRLGVVARQLPAHLGPAAARAGFWAAARHRWALGVLRRLRPRLVLANDWPALVVAAELKREVAGLRIHYDAHELATAEFDERPWWRLVYKPMVRHLEREAIAAADSISTVGQQLAAALATLYGLTQPPAVVRSTPGRIALPPPEPAAWPLRLLYHGLLLPGRGLETLIDTIPRWQVPHRLTIRGDGPSAYVDRLKRRVEATGRAELVSFAPPAPPDELMPLAAREADVGVFFIPLATDQHHFTLPNKLFEYIGSGLAVVVTPASDMKRVVIEHSVGVVANDASVEACANAINALDLERVAAFKANARRAAETLCWEVESGILARSLASLIQSERPRAAPPGRRPPLPLGVIPAPHGANLGSLSNPGSSTRNAIPAANGD